MAINERDVNHDDAPDGSPEAAGSTPAPTPAAGTTGSPEAVEETEEQAPQGPQFIGIRVNRCKNLDADGNCRCE